jgi:outer membrane protein assembly factor BamB
MHQYRSVKGILCVVLLSMFFMDFLAGSAVGTVVSVPTERWQAKTDQPPETAGEPNWRSVTIVDGIIYAYGDEHYYPGEWSKKHDTYQFYTIYAFQASTGYRMWNFTSTHWLENPIIDTPPNTAQQSNQIPHKVLYTMDHNTFYALDAINGLKLWTYSVPVALTWYLPPTDGVICLGIGNERSNSTCYVAGLNQTTGKEIWKHDFGYNSNLIEPAVGGGAIYFGLGDRYYAYNLDRGDLRWDVKVGNLTGGNLMVFYASSVSPAKQMPYANGKIYLTTGDKIYTLNAQNGVKVWSFSSDGYSFVTHPYIVGGHVFAVGCQANYGEPCIFVLNMATGRQLWNYSVAGHWSLGDPSVNYGIVTFESPGPTYCGLNATNGVMVWNHTSHTELVNNGGAIYSYDSRNLEAWNPIDGKVIWNFTLKPTTIGYWTGATYTLFLGEADDIAYFSAYDRVFGVDIPPVNLPPPPPTPTEDPSMPIPTDELSTSDNPNPQSQIIGSYSIVVGAVVAGLVLSILIFSKKCLLGRRHEVSS